MSEVRDHPDITRTTTPGATHPVQISRDEANDRASVIPPEIVDAHEFSLGTVAAGILGGARPVQFMDSINAANQQLGNRTFLRWVGGLRARRQDWSRETELFECCSKGNAGRFKHLLKHGPIDVNMGSRYGTLLSLAAFKGCTGIVRELLEVPGIDVNLGQERSVTPLYFAAQQGHTEMVKLLLAARGINVNLVTLVDGATPLFIAVSQG